MWVSPRLYFVGIAQELNSLKHENERLKEEVEILKKAAAYFAKELT